MTETSLPKIMWLWIPVSAFIFMLIGENFIYEEHMAWMVGENGPYELIQFAILVMCFGLAVHILFKMNRSSFWLMSWIVLAALCSFYVAGEEVSWGQHFLNWNTPDYWAAYNDQNETNLHNTSSWLDQKPRLLLSIAVYIGGLIIPFLMWKKPDIIPDRFSIIYPTGQFVMIAFICLMIKILDKFGEATGSHLLGRNAESEELFLFYFVLLYLLLMKERLLPDTNKS